MNVKTSRGISIVDKPGAAQTFLLVGNLGVARSTPDYVPLEVVGPLPHRLQTPAVFSAGTMTGSKQVAASDLLLKFLGSPEATPALIESGLERLR